MSFSLFMERREFFGGRKLDLSNILAVAVRITGSEGWTSESILSNNQKKLANNNYKSLTGK